MERNQAEMATLIKCPTCNQEVADTAASCPHCGGILPHKRKWYSYVSIFFGLIPLAAVVGLFCDDSAGNHPIMIFILLILAVFLIGAPFLRRR